MTISRREVLIGMAGLVGSSLRLLAEPDFMKSESGSNDPFHIEDFTCFKVTAAGMTYRLYQSQSSGQAVLLLPQQKRVYFRVGNRTNTIEATADFVGVSECIIKSDTDGNRALNRLDHSIQPCFQSYL